MSDFNEDARARRLRLEESLDDRPKRRKVVTDKKGRRSTLVFRSEKERGDLELAVAATETKDRKGRILTPGE